MAPSPLAALSRWWYTPRIRSNFLTALLTGAMLLFGLILGSWQRACAGGTCPSIASLVNRGYDPEQASKLYAADGRLITDLGMERRTLVPLSQISPAAVAAFVVTEDKRFYEHHGVDWVRFFGAVKANLMYIVGRGRPQGGSTITMQLAGNIFPEDINRQDKSFKRKLREIQVAYEIEHNFTKDKILALYLNQIDLGNRAFGVEAAAQRYFGKPARELNVAEAATLAALPKAPSRYNPRKNPQLAVYRRNLILGLMEDEGLLSKEDAERWKAYPLLLATRSDFSEVAPYFVEYVRQQLDTRFGPDLYRTGLRIYTTIDLDMQQAAERALTQQLEGIENGTYGAYPRKTYAQYIEGREEGAESPVPTPYLQGLAVTLEAKTGAIRAMVGGRDFNDSKFNRAVQALRQPGQIGMEIDRGRVLKPRHLFLDSCDDGRVGMTACYGGDAREQVEIAPAGLVEEILHVPLDDEQRLPVEREERRMPVALAQGEHFGTRRARVGTGQMGARGHHGRGRAEHGRHGRSARGRNGLHGGDGIR